MKLVSFSANGHSRLGARVDGARVVDLARADASRRRRQPNGGPALPGDCLGLLAGGDAALDQARATLEFAQAHDDELRSDGAILSETEIDLLPPLVHPPKILCVARNYGEHVAEINRERPELPILFMRFAQTLVGPGAPILRPWVSDQLDWEGELAVVIGRKARHVPAERAFDVVAGYSLFNDVSVRDYQLRTPQYTAGKNFDASGPFGPALVTADEIPDPHDLQLTVTLNGETMQSANTGEMIFSIPVLIEHISEWTTLQPGDVIATGTPAGVGHHQRPPRFLRPGDRVCVKIPELGVLENPVEQEPPAAP